MSNDQTRVSRRRLLQLAGTGVVGILAGCASEQPSSSPTEDPNMKTVEVGPDGRYVFTPGTDEPLQISSGMTVRFIWKSDTHNIHVESQPDDANWKGHEPIENTGFEDEHTFETKGEYHYWCEPHKGLGMVGDIIVD